MIFEPELSRAKDLLRAAELACRLFAETCAEVFVLMIMLSVVEVYLRRHAGRLQRTVGNLVEMVGVVFAREFRGGGASTLERLLIAKLNFVVNFLAMNRD